MKICKMFSVFLASMMLLGAVGCNDGEESSSSSVSQTKPVGTTNDRESHYVEGTLHKVNVTASSVVFTANKKTEYSIVCGEEGTHKESADFIFTHVRGATGAALSYASEDAVWSANAKYIVIGDYEMFEAAGLTMPKDDIGSVGYYIKTVGNSVFIMSNSKEGYQLGAIAFLRETVGYDMLAEDCVIYEKDGATLPNMDIVERPDYDVRVVSNNMSTAAAYGMGYTNGRGIIPVGGDFGHNSFDYLPPDNYLESNPDWYSDVLLIANGQEYRQLCYTAHGNESEYELMQETAMVTMVQSIKEEPDLSIISFTQEDVAYHCQCETCLEVVEEYGSYSAAIIMFVNDLSERLEVELEAMAAETGEAKREITICFFAYHVSEKPPAYQDENGEWVAVNGLKCNDNVAVFIAPIYAKYNRSFYDEINTVYADNIRGWTAVSDKIMMWLYQTNYAQYLYPFNTWEAQVEDYRFCKSMGAVYMFNEGQHDQPGAVSHFTKLKEYIDSKALFDVNINYNDVVDKFFKYYFLDAAEPMRAFFDQLQTHMAYLETEYEGTLTGHIRDQIAQTKFWPQGTLEGWMTLIDEAYAAIEKYKTVDPMTYEMLYEHILIESMFPRYALCSLYPSTIAPDVLSEMRQSFYEDCNTLNIETVYEWTSISGIFEIWGVG